jgi:D-amino-acid dehydrogenase
MPEEEETWFKLRACKPSGWSIISRAEKVVNLTFATGHAMMGLSLAPATGRVITEIISGKRTSVDTKMFQL